jgi:hypothetical protein
MNFTSDMPVLISYLVGLAIFYGYTNARLKALEDKLKNQNDIAERITRLEEKINLLLEFKMLQK